MTHQCNTSTLGSGAEEGDFDLLIAEDLGVFVNGVPCWLTDSRAVVLQRIDDVNATASIYIDFVPEMNKSENWPWSQPLKSVEGAPEADEETRVVTRGTEVEDSLANSRIGLFIDGTERGSRGLLSLNVGDGHTQETALGGQCRCARTRLGVRWGFAAAGSKREAEGIKFGSRALSRGETRG